MEHGSDGRSSFRIPNQGMSWWLKIPLALAALFPLAFIVWIVGSLIFVGYTDKKLDQHSAVFVQNKERLDRLAEEYPFEPPASGVVGPDQAEMFLAVTEEVWAEIEPWAEDYDRHARGEYMPDDDGGLLADYRGLWAGVTWLEIAARFYGALAESLERHQASRAEYVWAGEALLAAYRSQSETDGAPVPEANRELAGRYSDRLAEIGAEADGPGKMVVLKTARPPGQRDQGAAVGR